MIQPIRPHDATALYQRQVAPADSGPAEGATRTGNGAGRAGHRSDEVSISQQAQDLQRLLSAVGDQPDVREARVAELRQQLADGTYDVDAAAIAARLVDAAGDVA